MIEVNCCEEEDSKKEKESMKIFVNRIANFNSQFEYLIRKGNFYCLCDVCREVIMLYVYFNGWKPTDRRL